MNGREFRQWRDSLSLTRGSAATALNIPTGVLDSWEDEGVEIALSIEYATRYLTEHPEIIESKTVLSDSSLECNVSFHYQVEVAVEFLMKQFGDNALSEAKRLRGREHKKDSTGLVFWEAVLETIKCRNQVIEMVP